MKWAASFAGRWLFGAVVVGASIALGIETYARTAAAIKPKAMSVSASQPPTPRAQALAAQRILSATGRPRVPLSR